MIPLPACCRAGTLTLVRLSNTSQRKPLRRNAAAATGSLQSKRRVTVPSSPLATESWALGADPAGACTAGAPAACPEASALAVAGVAGAAAGGAG